MFAVLLVQPSALFSRTTWPKVQKPSGGWFSIVSCRLFVVLFKEYLRPPLLNMNSVNCEKTSCQLLTTSHKNRRYLCLFNKLLFRGWNTRLSLWRHEEHLCKTSISGIYVDVLLSMKTSPNVLSDKLRHPMTTELHVPCGLVTYRCGHFETVISFLQSLGCSWLLLVVWQLSLSCRGLIFVYQSEWGGFLILLSVSWVKKEKRKKARFIRLLHREHSRLCFGQGA